MELTNEQRARIDKGAAFLDEKRPGWHQVVNVNKLDVDSFSLCIVCQSMGMNFWDGCKQLGILGHDPEGGDFITPSSYGFYPHMDDTTDDPEKADQLAAAKNAYWREVIALRLEGVK